MDVPVIGGIAGGVGTTTLARALRAIDGGIYPGGVPVDVLVARSTMYSLGCAQRAVAATPQPPILAVVADAPRARLSSRTKARLRMTEPHLAAVVMVPFIGAWPDLDDPHQAAEDVLVTAELPKPLRGFAAALRQLVDQIAPRLRALSSPIAHPTAPAAGLYPVPPPPTEPWSGAEPEAAGDGWEAHGAPRTIAPSRIPRNRPAVLASARHFRNGYRR
jgi:hypothetical protein